jgi:PPOX class probable F420-dependent enzyme
MNLDTLTEFGARVERRLRQEQIIWLTTVRPDGTPEPSPVWFLWDGQTLLVFSQPNTPKLRNIERNPKVALNFDGNGTGGDIVVLTAEARIAAERPTEQEIGVYVEKYRQGIARIGLTPETMIQTYSVPIRVTPRRVRGH